MRRQHDICRPGKEWLQNLAPKESPVMQQAIVCASWYPPLPNEKKRCQAHLILLFLSDRHPNSSLIPTLQFCSDIPKNCFYHLTIF